MRLAAWEEDTVDDQAHGVHAHGDWVGPPLLPAPLAGHVALDALNRVQDAVVPHPDPHRPRRLGDTAHRPGRPHPALRPGRPVRAPAAAPGHGRPLRPGHARRRRPRARPRPDHPPRLGTGRGPARRHPGNAAPAPARRHRGCAGRDTGPRPRAARPRRHRRHRSPTPPAAATWSSPRPRKPLTSEWPSGRPRCGPPATRSSGGSTDHPVSTYWCRSRGAASSSSVTITRRASFQLRGGPRSSRHVSPPA